MSAKSVLREDQKIRKAERPVRNEIICIVVYRRNIEEIRFVCGEERQIQFTLRDFLA